MRGFIATLLVLTASASFAGSPVLATGPVFDKEGHKLAYVYPDLSRDLYSYDGLWRMTEFRSRTGEITKYAYRPDGSMITLKSDVIVDVIDR